MKITLTDRDGIEFDVYANLIHSIREKLHGSKIELDTGEVIYCKEHAIEVYQKIIDAKFREEH